MWEVQGTVQYICIENLNCKHIHHEIKAFYGELEISRRDNRICKQFENGRTNLTDKYREGENLNFKTLENVVIMDLLI